MVLPVRNDDGEGTPQNSISFQQITDEFGNPTQNKFGAYRVSQDIGGLSNLPLDDGIPQSGEIKFSDFYSKKLNVVVNCHSGPSEDRVNARDHKWANDNVDVIGNFKGKKIGGSKIIIHVNKQISSAPGSQNTCALRTGNFNTAHSLQVDIGAEGSLHGAGGAGGYGADGKSDHGPTSGGGEGGDGNSALGITYNGTTVNVLSGGKILCGYGGGAGGRGARDVDPGADRTACGGGGGGGMGIPGGAAGEDGTRLSGGEDEVAVAGQEEEGTPTHSTAGEGSSAGRGGEGGDNNEEAKGQDGGRGGDSEQSPGFATGGKDLGSGEDPGVNANPGSNGAAIRRTSGYTVIINKADDGTIEGATDATGVA